MNQTDAPECLAAREALSALLDQEEPGVAVPWLTAHVVDCAACRGWYASAQDVGRVFRVATTPVVPPLRRLIDDTVAQQPSAHPFAARLANHLPRLVLGTTGLLLLWLSGPLLLLGRDPDAGVHPAHELGSFEVALAVAVLLATARPRLARPLAPVVGSVGALLLATALVDLAHAHRTSWTDEAPHLLWLIAFAALVVLPRTTRPAPALSSTPLTRTPPGRDTRLRRPAHHEDPGTPSAVHRSA